MFLHETQKNNKIPIYILMSILVETGFLKQIKFNVFIKRNYLELHVNTANNVKYRLNTCNCKC